MLFDLQHVDSKLQKVNVAEKAKETSFSNASEPSNRDEKSKEEDGKESSKSRQAKSSRTKSLEKSTTNASDVNAFYKSRTFDRTSKTSSKSGLLHRQLSRSTSKASIKSQDYFKSGHIFCSHSKKDNASFEDRKLVKKSITTKTIKVRPTITFL